MKKIIIGSDHAGYRLKEIIKGHIKNHQITDVGCYDENSTHYPVIAQELASRINSEEYEKGILICGTGLGMSIAANRFNRVRACLCHDNFTAEMSRKHNDSNVLVLGSRVTEESPARAIVDIWLDTEFEGGRHQTRLDLIEQERE